MSQTYKHQYRFEGGRFYNPRDLHEFDWSRLGDSLRRYWTDSIRNGFPNAPIPVHTLTQEQLLSAPDNSLYRLGHSTQLLKLHNRFWLTDPVFSERASFSQQFGPKRFHASPISITELPELEVVILSHDHYDHLDRAAVMALAQKTRHFLAPLKVGERLLAWGVERSKVTELDWWQQIEIDGVTFTCTPSQHASGRGLLDKNRTLWCSWCIRSNDLNLFFSGDSGYFTGFEEIGRHFGPFDLTMVETGAYDKNWPDVHMQPEESLQAHLDLRGQHMLPIHNGTFNLSLHPWFAPFEQISRLAETHGVALCTPMMGERLNLNAPVAQKRWWRELVTQEHLAVELPLQPLPQNNS